ncbi:MAG: DUF2208 family protein [Desulfurococcaceae archaeon]
MTRPSNQGSSARKMIIIQVASLITLALLSALTPREYLWIVFLLYFVVIMAITSKSVMKAAKKVDKPRSLLLFEEKNTAVAMSSDAVLLNELKKQMSTTMLSLMLPLILFLAFTPLYWQYVHPTLLQVLKNILNYDFLVLFVAYLVFYSILILMSLGTRRLLLKSTKMEKQILIPRSFAVYRDGVIADGRFFEFTSDMCYEVNTARRFAAIYSKNLPFTIRLYTLEASKLKNALKEVKISECQ